MKRKVRADQHGTVTGYGYGCRCERCNTAQKAYNQRRYRGNQRIIERETRRLRMEALKTGPCADCGGSFPTECMDFDHRPGVLKVANVSRLISSLPKLLEEIAKCDLVCANCHRIRTRKRAQPTTP